MALSYNPRTVMDGLVLYLDAGNPKSYDYKENLLTYTNSIGDANYSNGGCTIVLNAAVAPNGTVTATSIDQGASANNYVYGGAPQSLTANTVYTYSIYIKQGNTASDTVTIDEAGFGGKRYQMTFTYATETLTSGITGLVNDGAVLGTSYDKLQNGWYRISITFRTSTTGVSSFIDMITRFSGPGLHYVWGRQLEKNSTMNVYTANTNAVTNKSTSWYDLTSNGNIATLTNGPLFNPNNKGSIGFDGVDDYISTNYIPTNSLGSINVWFRLNAHKDYNTIFDNAVGANDWEFWVYSTGIARFRSTADNSDYILDSDTLLINTWYNFVITWNSVESKMYKNGTLISQDTATGTKSIPSYLYIGGGNAGNTKLNGNISLFSIYNRDLSASEIKQNFNSLRGRYGI